MSRGVAFPVRPGILPRMQTFGKRQYAHLELDPWAKRKTPRETKSRASQPRESSIPTARIAGYLIALAMVGVVAFASFEMLVLA